MVWPAVIGALGAIGSGALGQSGAHKSNRTALAIWREQREFMDQMSRTEIQRRVQDMTAAGINPMLSVMGMGGASSPNVSPPSIQNEGAAPAAAAMEIGQIAASAAQIKVAEAQARKTEAEAKIIESEIPWSAQNAQQRSELLFSQARTAAHGVGIAQIEQALKSGDLDKLQPLRVELQDALVKAEKLGLSEKQAISELYKSFSQLKGAERILPMLLPIILKSIGSGR